MNYDILDFKAQAEQMLRILDPNIQTGGISALNLLMTKFKELYEQGIFRGKNLPTNTFIFKNKDSSNDSYYLTLY